MIVQVIEGTTVVNVIVVPDNSTLSGNTATWPESHWTGPVGVILMNQIGAGIGWTLVDGVLKAP